MNLVELVKEDLSKEQMEKLDIQAVFASCGGYKPEYTLIMGCVAGSHLYGLSTPKSDVDHRGVFMVPRKEMFHKRVEQVSDEKNDSVFYELLRFTNLLRTGNPTVMELLFVPDEKILLNTFAFQMLRNNRHIFVSRSLVDAFGGYAFAQIQKAKGQNKKFHLEKEFEKGIGKLQKLMKDNAIPWKELVAIIPENVINLIKSGKFGYIESPEIVTDWKNDEDIQKLRHPELKQFVYFMKANGKPVLWEKIFRDFHGKCAKVEHTENMYRVYESDDEFIKGDQVACSSISIEDEANTFKGIAIVNANAYSDATKRYHQFWEWVKSRNENRWIGQLGGEQDYDVKNMMHCIRLLKSCVNTLTVGEPKITWYGKDRDLLMSIRNGTLSYDEIMKMADRLNDEINELKVSSSVPKKVDNAKIDDLVFDIYNKYWKENER